MPLKTFKNIDDLEFKPEFEERYKDLLGADWNEYCRYTFSYITRSIRINTIKTTENEVRKRLKAQGWRLNSVPFIPYGFWVEHEEGRLDIGNTKEHALGLYYVQEAASMIPPIALDAQPGDIILDMCSSPGSKTTQIAQLMNNEGLLVANDFQGQRMAPLVMNVQRMGLTNVMTTLMYGQWFAKKKMQFDRVLVDAPCSGSGTIRKSQKTLQIWNPTMVSRLSSTQKKLLSAGYEVLKPGGTLVYSTCSNEPEENEGVVSWFLENHDVSIVPIHIKNLNRSDTIMEFDGEKYHPDVQHCIRLWPQDNDTEGFFVAKFVKN